MEAATVLVCQASKVLAAAAAPVTAPVRMLCSKLATPSVLDSY